MKTLLILTLTLGASVGVGACGATVSDAPNASLSPENRTAGAAARPATALFYRDVTIPDGTSLPLILTSSVASDTSAVEDAVSAELTRPVAVDGREVLPAGTQLAGVVTAADSSGRVKGRARVAFQFTSLSVGNTQYDVRTAQLSHVASATKSEDATKIGIGAGAGAIIGGILGGKDGAAKGAVVGGGAGTGVVLATKGKEVRLGPGADATTQLTAPLTVRVRRS